MLINSAWNQQPNILTNENEFIGGDSDYWDTKYIIVVKPICQADLEQNPDRKDFNTQFNLDRGLIEHTFGQLKQKFRIFDLGWRRHKDLFPVALRVCLKLLNKYWRLDGNLPLGLQRAYGQLEEEYGL